MEQAVSMQIIISFFHSRQCVNFETLVERGTYFILSQGVLMHANTTKVWPRLSIIVTTIKYGWILEQEKLSLSILNLSFELKFYNDQSTDET